MIDVRVFCLPRRKLFEDRFKFSKRIEAEIESLVKGVPHDYNVPAKAISVQVTSDYRGRPTYAIITVEMPD